MDDVELARAAERFVAEHGRAPFVGGADIDESRLGRWASDARSRRDSLPDEARAILDRTPMLGLGRRIATQLARLEELRAFVAEHGRPPSPSVPGERDLAIWSRHARRRPHEGGPAAEIRGEVARVIGSAPGAPVPPRRKRASVVDPEPRRQEREVRLEELRAFIAEHGRRPTSAPGELPLLRWAIDAAAERDWGTRDGIIGHEAHRLLLGDPEGQAKRIMAMDVPPASRSRPLDLLADVEAAQVAEDIACGRAPSDPGLAAAHLTLRTDLGDLLRRAAAADAAADTVEAKASAPPSTGDAPARRRSRPGAGAQ